MHFKKSALALFLTMAATSLANVDQTAPININNLRGNLEPEDETLPSCDYSLANSIAASIEPFYLNAGLCRENIGENRIVVLKTINYYKFRIEMVEKVLTISRNVEKVDSTIDRVSAFVNKIPKVGPVIKKIQTALDKLKNISDQIADQDKEKLEKLKKAVDLLIFADGKLGSIESLASAAETGGSALGDALASAVQTSKDHDCCGSSTINNLSAALVPESALDLASDGFEICGKLDLGIDFPDVDLGVLDAIADVVETIQKWIDEIVGDFVDGANYHFCCNPVLNAIGQIAEGISDVFNLATCWADGLAGGLINESLDVLLPKFQVLVDSINSSIDDTNHFINRINNFSIDLPNIEVNILEISFDEPTCSFDITGPGIDSEVVNYSPFDIPNVDRIKFDTDGSFDLGAIGKSIASDCGDALDALTSSDGVDCCPVARIKAGIPEEGWPVRHSCNYDGDCGNGNCIGGECTDFSLGTTCNFDGECDSGRCEGIFPSRCAEKLGSCAECNEDDDCLSGKCILRSTRSVCALSNGKMADACFCDFNSHCQSGRCEGAFPPYQCKPRLGYGSSCNEDSDCTSGNCAGGKCSDGRLGSNCDHDSDCDSGRCDGTCKAKLGSCQSCNEHADCQSGKCLLRSTRSVCALSNGKTANNCFCDLNGHCQSGRCEGAFPPYQCKAKLGSGEGCNEDTDCRSNDCKGFLFGQKCA